MSAPDLQPSLFDVPLEPIVRIPSAPKGNGRPTIAERFAEFDALNPHIYVLLRSLALNAKRAGFKRWAIDGAFQVLRYQAGVQTQGDTYKLNNDFRALYARKIMDNTPDLAGFFETRGENDDASNEA